MRATDLQTIYDYVCWANERILDTARQVSPDEFLAPRPFSHGGLRGTLAHVLGAEWAWRQRTQLGVSPTALLPETDYPSLAVLRERWLSEMASMRSFLAGLKDEDLDRTVDYRNTRGVPHSATLWHILYHVANHGTQHRGEVAAMLTDLGHSPGDIDFSVWKFRPK